MTRTFTRPSLALATAVLLFAVPGCAASTSPPPVLGGPISTMPQGQYACELPGDAAGPVGVPQPKFEFRIANSSSYKVDGVRGSYLLVGDTLSMTSGKLKGLKLHRLSRTFLREYMADGSDGQMRCILIASTAPKVPIAP